MSLDAKKVLVDWANDQQNWVRLLIREILASKVQAPENTIEEVYQLFANEANLIDGPFVEISKLEYGENETSNIESLIINSLSQLNNVNKLALNQSIEFNPAMTVVFGENAAGKSGYIRVFKSLGAVRSKELILPNINKTVNGKPPTAVVQYHVGDQKKVLEWKGDEGIIPFNRLSIFDTRAMSFHLDDDLTYVYIPRDLSLFKLAHESIDKVKRKLEEEKNRIKPTKNPFTTRFNRSSEIYSRIETLGPTTDIEHLKKLAVITEAETKEITTLKEQVQSLSPASINSKLAIAKNDHEFFSEIDEFLNRIGKFDFNKYNELLDNYTICKEKHVNAGEKLFEIEHMPWRKKYTYGTFGNNQFERGQLTYVQINNDDDSSAEVFEYYNYDEWGNVTSSGIKADDFYDSSPTITYVLYEYDNWSRHSNKLWIIW